MTIDDIKGKNLFWIAINGSSCAISRIQFRWPIKVTPSPEILVGFVKEGDAIDAQHDALNIPANRLKKFWDKLSNNKNAVIIKLANHGPQTYGQTIWEEV